MALFELDDIFGYQQANDIKRLWAGNTAPDNPGDGEVWLDTSVTPIALKRYNNTAGTWDIFAGGITVDSNGNVGIGIENPTYTLELERTGENAIIVANRTDGATAYFGGSNLYANVGTLSNHSLRLVTNSTGKMIVDTDGHVGIGTETPTSSLEIQTTGEPPLIILDRTDGATAQISSGIDRTFVGSRSNHPVHLLVNQLEKVTVDTNGNLGVGTKTPDYSLEVERSGENAQVVTNRTDGATTILSGTDVAGFVGTMSNHDLRITVNDTTRVIVDTNGNLGINTTSPTEKLDVVGNGKISGTMTVIEQLVIPTDQPSTLVNGSIWIA